MGQQVTQVKVGNIPYVLGSRRSLTQLALDEKMEVSALIFEIKANVKSSAAAFALAAADSDTIARGFVSRILCGWDGDTDACQLTATEARSLAIEMTGADPMQVDPQLRAPNSIPISSGAGINVKMRFVVPFRHRGAESPNLFSPSSDQLMAEGANTKLEIEWGTSTLTALVLAAGTANFTSIDCDVYAEVCRAYGVYVSPHWTFKTESATSEVNKAQNSEGIEWVLAHENDPVTAETTIASLTLDVDGDKRPVSVSPTSLAALYQLQRGPLDSVLAFDLTIANNAMGSQDGAKLTPIRWVDSARKAAEYELPYYTKGRTVQFSKVSGQSVTYKLLRAATGGIRENEDIIRTLARKHGRPADVDALRVRGLGGGDNDTLPQLKGRWIIEG